MRTLQIANFKSQSAIRNPQSEICNPQSAICNPQSAIGNPQSLTPPQNPRLEFPPPDRQPLAAIF
jgi:hypothetical protein